MRQCSSAKLLKSFTLKENISSCGAFLRRNLGYTTPPNRDSRHPEGKHTRGGIARRLKAAHDDGQTDIETTKALVGAHSPPKDTVSQLFQIYERDTRDRRVDKSPEQMRVWQGRYLRAQSVLQEVKGDVPLEEMTRRDGVAVRECLARILERASV